MCTRKSGARTFEVVRWFACLSPFHNWRTTTLKHFAILLFGNRTMARQRCTSCRFRCMRFSARLRSRLIFKHVWNSEATVCDTFYRTGSHIVSTSIVQRCVYSQEWCTNSWGRKMIRMLRCECCATMRLLLDVWHVILQRCTTVARLLGTLPSSIYYTLFKHRIVIEVQWML